MAKRPSVNFYPLRQIPNHSVVHWPLLAFAFDLSVHLPVPHFR